jgi:tripeptidyl-peptidase I
VEFQGQGYFASDLNLFFETYRTDQVGHTPTLISVEGGELSHSLSESLLMCCSGDPTTGGVITESNMDLEYMMGLLGPQQNVSLYQVGESTDSEDISMSLVMVHVPHTNPHFMIADELLAALDGSYCSVAPVSSEGAQRTY